MAVTVSENAQLATSPDTSFNKLTEDEEKKINRELVERFIDQKYRAFNSLSGMSFSRVKLTDFILDFQDWFVANQ